MFQFLTHVELSRSMAAILEMPQYVAYQKNVVYTFIKLSAKSHSFNILRTMDGLSCPTIRGCHVYCNFKIGFTCRINVNFGTLKDGSLLINTLASNICFSYRNMF